MIIYNLKNILIIVGIMIIFFPEFVLAENYTVKTENQTINITINLDNPNYETDKILEKLDNNHYVQNQAISNMLNQITNSHSITLDFLSQLGATLLGVIAATGATMAWDRKKDREIIEENKKRTIDALIEELTVFANEWKNGKYANLTWDSTNKRFIGDYGTANIPAFHSSIHSGNYNLLSAKLQSTTSSLYLQIEILNENTKNIENFFTSQALMSPYVDNIARNLCKKNNETHKLLEDSINSVIEALKAEKPKPKKRRFKKFTE